MKKLSKQQVKNFKKGAVALTLAAAMGLAGLSAFFTDSKTKVNEFTVGNVKQELIEDKWDKATEEGAHDNITPNSTFDKDPKVKNTGTNSQYVFITVTVPKANVALADGDGTRNITELFTYDTNPGWKKLDSKTNIGEDSNTYVYAYATGDALTALVSEAETPTLFDTIKFANIVENEKFAKDKLDVTVKSYGIQTTNLGETTPEKVWDIVSKEAK